VKYAALLSIAFVCAPAVAQDDPAKKPDPAPPAPAPVPAPPAPSGGEKKPEAKKERKVDAAAMKALDRYKTLVHAPASAGIKSVAGKGAIEQGGMRIGIDPKWSEDAGFDIEVTLPDQLKQMMEAQGKSPDQIVGLIKFQMGFSGINTAFETPGRNWSHFDVGFAQKGDDQVVSLTAFDDKADAESREYVFGKDGLLKTSSVSLKADNDNPQLAMLAGQPLESEWTYEKKGERSLLTSRTLSIMGTQIETKFAYFEGPGGSFLLKEATTSSPMGDQAIKFNDYTVDGKAVESTKAAAAPAKTGEKTLEKPADKPADKPAGDPPAPTPPAPAPAPAPAPKDDGK